jgi:hypothetical protein
VRGLPADRVPDWAIFRLFGDCLLLVIFLEITEVA